MTVGTSSFPQIKLHGQDLTKEADSLLRNGFLIDQYTIQVPMSQLQNSGSVFNVTAPPNESLSIRTSDVSIETRTYRPIGFAGYSWEQSSGDDPYAHLSVLPSLDKIVIVRTRERSQDTDSMTKTLNLNVIYCWEKFVLTDEELQ